MAKPNRSIWDDLLEVGRRILKEIDDFFEPQAPPLPERAPVPVPARKRGQPQSQPRK